MVILVIEFNKEVLNMGKNKGGRPRKLTPLEEQGVYQMHKEGRPQAEIAYKYGIGTTTVYRIVKRIEKGEKNE
jgi:DNA invertase Pin-like site-specific DNA recombinase